MLTSIFYVLFTGFLLLMGATVASYAARSTIAATIAGPHAYKVRAVPLTAVFGMMVIVTYVIVAALAPIIAPFGETVVVGSSYEPASPEHLLGTDKLGRDLLSRLIYGARNTVGLAFVTNCLAFLVGVTLGVLAAIYGGLTDQVISRFVDAIIAIPGLVFALLLLTVFGTNAVSLIFVIGMLDSVRVFRLARSVAMTVVVMDYVEASRLRGDSLFRMITKVLLKAAEGR